MDDAPEVSPRALRLKEELLGDFSLRVDDVAAILEVDRSTVNRYIQDGALVALKIGREYRLSEPDVREFLQALVARERQRVGGLRMRALTGDAEGRGGSATTPGARLLGRFSERAQHAVAAAQAEARSRAAREVAPEHLLLALLSGGSEDETAAMAVLRSLGVDIPGLRQAVEALVPPPSPGGDEPGALEFNPACRDVVVERAPAIARHAGRNNVEPEDLLVALYAVRTVGDVLRAAGASEAGVRVELRRLSPPPTLTRPEQPLRDDVTATSIWVQARAEALMRASSLVSAAHVLLALLADAPGLSKGPARLALEDVRADLGTLRAAAEGVLPPAPLLPPMPPVPPRGGGARVISRGGFVPAFWQSTPPDPTPGPGSRFRPVLSRQVREVDYHAFRAADAMGHGQMGAEHLLLGLCALPDMAGILMSAGVEESALRDAVWRVRESAPPLQRELSCDFNTVGISDDDDPGAADMDGEGASYSRQALEGAGLRPGEVVEVEGMSFEWPAASPGTPDNVRVTGQVIPLAMPPGAERLGLLGAATGRSARGLATVLYDDGTAQRFSLAFGDWVTGSGESRVVAGAAYRNTRRGRQGDRPHVYFTSVALQPGRVATHLCLPAEVDGGRLHVFSIAAG